MPSILQLSTSIVDQLMCWQCVSLHHGACGCVFGTLFVFINNKVIRNCNLLAKRITAVITMATQHRTIRRNPTAAFQCRPGLDIPIHLAVSMRVYLCRLAVFTGCILVSPDPWFIVVAATEHASGSSIPAAAVVVALISTPLLAVYIFSYTYFLLIRRTILFLLFSNLTLHLSMNSVFVCTLTEGILI